MMGEPAFKVCTGLGSFTQSCQGQRQFPDCTGRIRLQGKQAFQACHGICRSCLLPEHMGVIEEKIRLLGGKSLRRQEQCTCLFVPVPPMLQQTEVVESCRHAGGTLQQCREQFFRPVKFIFLLGTQGLLK